MSRPPLDQALAHAVVELARERSLSQALESAMRMLMDVVPGADAAAILVWDCPLTDASVATDAGLRQVLDHHTARNATPLLEACERLELVYSGDLGRELRWQEFSRDLAGSLGINSLLAVPMTLQGLPLGVFAIFAQSLDAFGVEEQEAAQIAALHATAALADSLERRLLSRRLAQRTVLGQATEVVMKRFSLDATTAFAVLQRLSDSRHEELRELSARVVATRLIE
jgi:hypothetical protein